MYRNLLTVLGSIVLLGVLACPGWAQPRAGVAVARSQFFVRPTTTIGATNVSTLNSGSATALAFNQRSAALAFRENNRFTRDFNFNNGFNNWFYPYRNYGYGYGSYGYYPYGYNPYYSPYNSSYGGASYVPYASASTYGTAGSYGSGASPYSYGSTSPYGPVPGGSAPVAPAGNAPQPKGGQPLTAFGIPNDDGDIKWPLAFRLLPPGEGKELLQKTQAQLQISATQAVVGTANPNLLKEASRSVAQLHQWLRDHRVNMTEAGFLEGEFFLQKLDKAIGSMGPA